MLTRQHNPSHVIAFLVVAVVTCLDSTCYPMDGTWDTVTSKLRLRSQGSIAYNVGQMKYSVAFAAPGIVPPSSGLPTNSEDVKISLVMSGSTYPDLADTPMLSTPCIGICSVHVGYDVPREGQVAQFNLDITTANRLSPGDELNMNLTQIVQGPYDASVVLTGTHASYFTGRFTGTSNGMEPTGTGIFILKCTASVPSRDVKISIARSNALKIFSMGVPSGFKFDVNASDATNKTTIGPVTTTRAPTSAQAVGRVLESKISYDVDFISHYTDLRNNFAGALSLAGEPTAIQVSCAFSSDLKSGEQIQLYLPGFTSSQSVLNMKDSLDSMQYGNLVDDSAHFDAVWSAASSTITFTLKHSSGDVIVSDYRRPTINRMTRVNITVVDGQVNLPSGGLNRNSSQIYISTNAVDGPVAATAIVDSPAIGAVLFSHLSCYRGANATKGGQLHKDSVGDYISPGDEAGIKFQVTLNEKLEQNDILYLKLPGFTSAADIVSVAMDTYQTTASNFFKGNECTNCWSASWDLSEELLAMTCVIPGGCDSSLTQPITFDVKESNNIKTPTNGFLAGVPNDASKKFYLYSKSTIAPLPPTTITNVQGVGFDNVHVMLLPQTHLAAGEVAYLDFSFKLASNMVLYQGDNITCSLSGFARDDSTDERLPLHLDTTDSFNHAWFDDTADKLIVRLNGTLSHGTTARFKIGGLKVPTGGIDVVQSQVFSCGAKASDTLHQSLSTNTFDFSTPVSSFTTVGYMHSSSLSFSPRIAGKDSTITFVVNLNSVVAVGEALDLILPDFTLSSTGVALAVTSSGFTVSSSTSVDGVLTLRFVATTAVTSQNTPITIVVAGVALPAKGVEEDSLKITFKSETVKGIISMPTPVSSTNGVNTFQNHAVSFFPADTSAAITMGGDKRRFKMLDTDRLFDPQGYVNKTVLIGSEHFFVEKIEGDTLIATTAWAGADVVGSAPSTYLYYPGYRPAQFHGGSSSESIIFKYIVQEGDVASDLRMHNVSDVDLWQGSHIKRTSTTPTTVANTALPRVWSRLSVYSNSEIKIDTTQPHILQVNSTKRDGNYGIVGEQIDVCVIFSHPVSVYRPEAVSISVPAIELNVDSSDNLPRFAYYSSGNNTAKLTFVYTIQEGDNVDDLGYKHHKQDLYSTGTVDGLSAITTVIGSNRGYIYRRATNLIQPANVSLPNPGFGRSMGYKKSINVNTTISSNRHGYDDPWMSGKFSRVLSVSSITENGRYAAGHMIDLLVSFNENVTVDTRGGRPYIAMEVGTGTTLRKAEYVDYKTDTNYFNHSLVFRYTVQAGDTSGDLNFKCTCSDFCMTTYIEKVRMEWMDEERSD